MTFVDHLSQTITFEEAVLQFQPIFLEYIQKQGDWRYQYAALMVASQLAVEDATPDALSLIAQWAFKETEHNHPKVRYAALQLIGQYSEDMNPEFQEMFYDSFTQMSGKLVQDPVPRVVAHTFSSATNFFEASTELWKV